MIENPAQAHMKKLLLTLFLAVNHTFACTDFLIKSQDNAVIVGRSMEFGIELPTQLQYFKKGETFVSDTPQGVKGLQWESKYNYMGLVISFGNALVDGFNEKGLSIGILWFPGAEYPNVTDVSTTTILDFLKLSNWILGSFSNVDEVKKSIEDVNIYAHDVPGFPSIPPIHLSLHDVNGKTAVIEFSKRKMKFYDNPIGVLTNAPDFPWHVTNLRNYINLSAIAAGNVNFNGTVLEPTGQGSGLLGIPGDWTPPSRFVRAAAFKKLIATPKDAKATANAAMHILNTVDIPYGVVRGIEKKDFDYTQWIVIKDLTNKVLYIRTYGDFNLQKFDLQKISTGPIKINGKPEGKS